MKQYLFGIDIGGTAIKIGLFTTEGELVEIRDIPTRTENRGEHLLTDLSAEIHAIMEEQKLTVQKTENTGVVLGAGLAVPGAVYKDQGVYPCVNLNGWGGEDTAGELSALIHMPVKVLNDANAAALGELWMGSGTGYKDLVFVTLGTGIGGGVILNGELVTGAHGSAGEVGHIKLADGEEADALKNCGCGKRGCAEQYASATGLIRLAEAVGFTGKNEKEKLTAKEITEAAFLDRDPLAMKAVEIFADKLGRMLAAVSCVVDPEAILIGGGVSHAGEPLCQMCAEAFRRYAFPASEETKILLAQLGNGAGMYGAAKWMLM